jgi:hypothetical protein
MDGEAETGEEREREREKKEREREKREREREGEGERGRERERELRESEAGTFSSEVMCDTFIAHTMTNPPSRIFHAPPPSLSPPAPPAPPAAAAADAAPGAVAGSLADGGPMSSLSRPCAGVVEYYRVMRESVTINHSATHSTYHINYTIYMILMKYRI